LWRTFKRRVRNELTIYEKNSWKRRGIQRGSGVGVWTLMMSFTANHLLRRRRVY